MRARTVCLTLLLAAVMAGCGGAGDAGDEAAPEYAATVRKALESWVTAVRGGDIELMCRLLYPPARTCDRAFVEKRLFPHVRDEMDGLKGDLRYGAIDIGAREARVVIGVVTSETFTGYAVPIRRGMTQWVIDKEQSLFGRSRLVLERPDPAAALPSGQTEISFTGWCSASGSVYPQAELWIDSRHVDGRLEVGEDRPFGLERVRWIGAAQLRPGPHVMVAAVKGDGGIARTSAWLLTVRVDPS